MNIGQSSYRLPVAMSCPVESPPSANLWIIVGRRSVRRHQHPLPDIMVVQVRKHALERNQTHRDIGCRDESPAAPSQRPMFRVVMRYPGVKCTTRRRWSRIGMNRKRCHRQDPARPPRTGLSPVPRITAQPELCRLFFGNQLWSVLGTRSGA